MNKYYVELYTKVYYSAIIEAENESSAINVAMNAKDEMHIEETCSEVGDVRVISDLEAEEWDIPRLREIISGYEVKQ